MFCPALVKDSQSECPALNTDISQSPQIEMCNLYFIEEEKDDGTEHLFWLDFT